MDVYNAHLALVMAIGLPGRRPASHQRPQHHVLGCPVASLAIQSGAADGVGPQALKRVDVQRREGRHILLSSQ